MKPQEFDNQKHFNSVTGQPLPGIYKNVPFEQYLSWKAISNSSLHAAARSMKHFDQQKAVEETPSMRLGTLCHVGKFEPMMVAQRYVVMPRYELGDDGTGLKDPKTNVEYKNPKATTIYKKLVENFQAANIGKIIVEQHEYDKAYGMISSLAAHEKASELLSILPESVPEVAIVWEDEDTGLLCKGRCDVLHQRRRLVSDLKTSNYVENFEKQILDRAYHRQGAFYVDGLLALTGEEHRFSLTAVESLHPFDVRAAVVSEEAIEIGRKEYREYLRQILAAQSSGEWVGYASPPEWNLPQWARPETMKVEDGVLTSW